MKHHTWWIFSIRSFQNQARARYFLLAAWLLGISTASLAQSLSVHFYPVPTTGSIVSIARGPDNAVWFTERAGNKIGRINPSGSIIEYPVTTLSSEPYGIVMGPDGNLWFTELGSNKIGRITPAGAITEYNIPTPNSCPAGIAAGPDGALWFTEVCSFKIGRISTAGSFSEYSLPLNTAVNFITSGPDTALWFAAYPSTIGRITPSGTYNLFSIPTPASNPDGITVGPDGALWFVEEAGNKIGRLTTAGTFSEYPIPTPGTLPFNIVSAPAGPLAGPSGALWFSEASANKIGRITTAGVITEYSLPTATGFSRGITIGTDGALWFTGNNVIGTAAIAAPVTLVTASLPAGSVNLPFAGVTLQAQGGTSPYTWSGTGLPSGMSVSPAGLLSGTPTVAGTFNVTLTVTDSSTPPQTTQKTLPPFAISSLPPVIGPNPFPPCHVGVPFSYQITASNNPTSYNATGLPSPLSINMTSGLISGTPATIGTYNVTLSAANAGGPVTQALTLNCTLPPPVITSPSAAAGQVGAAFTYQIAATNSPTSYNALALPAALSINTTTGLISGTPATIGTFTVTLSATNAGGPGTQPLTLTINPPPPVITSPGMASGQVGVAFTYQITATNSPTTYSAAPLPAGLSINTATGLISGTPVNAETATVTLSASNAGGSGPQTLTLTIAAAAPAITSAGTTTGQVGTLFSYQIAASNNPTSYNAAPLPAGLSINTSSGLISGTPETAGTVIVTLSATNAVGTGTLNLTLTINNATAPAITSPGTFTCQVGTPCNYQVTATNNPTSYNATGLPAQLSINAATGLISGTPATSGIFNVTLSASNGGGPGTQLLALTVTSAAPVITSPGTLTCLVGAPCSYQITATASPTSYNASPLPTGLLINTASGLISGTLATPGTFIVNLAASNAGGTGMSSLTVTTSVTLPVITSPGTATAVVGIAFNYQITATNSPTNYTATPLLAGLSLNAATGLISGIPATAGTFTVNVGALNAGGPGSLSLIVTVYPAVIILTPTLSSGASVTDPGNLAPDQQIRISMSVPEDAAAPASTVSGSLNVSFLPAPQDPTMLFQNGLTTVNFSILGTGKLGTFTSGGQQFTGPPVGSVGFQPGSNAGTMTFSVIGAPGVRVLVGTLQQATIPSSKPTMICATCGVSVLKNSNGMTVSVIGFSTTREIAAATFTFSGPGLTPQSPTVEGLSKAFSDYFARRDASALNHGSSFILSVPFTIVNGTPSQFNSVTVTLTNSQGASESVTTAY